MRVTVIGGGVIGMCCAHYLGRAGVRVTVVERDRVGEGCSLGNGGWICPSISTPLPAPGLASFALASALRPGSPLHIRPSALPALAPWLLAFLRKCNADDYARGLGALGELNRPTFRLYDELAASGLKFEYHRRGILLVFTDPKTLVATRDELAAMRYPGVVELDPPGVRELESAFTGTISGGLLVEREGHARSDQLCRAIADEIRAGGGEVIEGCEVRALLREGDRVVAAEGVRGRGGDGDPAVIESDAIVVAAGAETGRIARRLGARLPLTAGKGYSLTVHRPRIHARRPSYVAGTRVGMTPFEGMLRVLGTMELSGINRRLDRRRVDALRRTILEVVPGALEGERVEAWVGMRPVTSDGLPAIGRLPGIRNVYVATGHQMLGVTLGPSTGYALADLITEGTSDIDLSPFDPGRFA